MKLKPHITPRYYQIDSVNAALSALKNNIKSVPVIQLPTGTGKSIVTVLLTSIALKHGRSVLHITDTRELVRQNYLAAVDCLDGDCSSEVGILSSGLGEFEVEKPVIYAGIQTLVNRVDSLNKINLVVIDECHMVSVDSDSMYQKTIAALYAKNPDMRVIGMTATPYRLGQGLLTDSPRQKNPELEPVPPFFTEICYSMSTKEAIDKGFLCNAIAYENKLSVDLKGVKLTAGDYNEKEASSRFSIIIPAACVEVANAVKELKLGKIIVFTTDVINAYECAKHLPNSRIIIGDMSNNEYCRDENFDWFAEPIDYEKPKYLINVMVCTKGFNQPDSDAGVLLFATKSVAKFIQCVGRVLRLSNGKSQAVIFDYGTNISRHGSIDDPIIPKLSEQKKTCDCGAECWKSAKKCWKCGEEFKAELTNDDKRCDDDFDKKGNKIRSGCGAINKKNARRCTSCDMEFVNKDRTKSAIGGDLFGSQTVDSDNGRQEIKTFIITPHTSKAGNEGFKALINGKYIKYFAIQTVWGLKEYEKAKHRHPTEFIIKEGGDFPKIKLIWSNEK